jgi:hypothetical protein
LAAFGKNLPWRALHFYLTLPILYQGVKVQKLSVTGWYKFAEGAKLNQQNTPHQLG